MLNVVALRGRLSRPPVERVLPTTGDRVLALEVSVRRDGAPKAESVPVVWFQPPKAADGLAAGDEVVVVGHVARRFFRAGGATQSRTEVVASTVVPVRHVRRAGGALAQAAACLEAALAAVP
ncbi:MAG TPA: hypothetical protein VFO65_12990 [Acidimicrobiales bacterium]|nr:hypothetical protein [Acidimicrobiales bacterium]